MLFDKLGRFLSICRRDGGGNLVDPASSHMLVWKIKPCMSQYKYLYSKTANGSVKQLQFLWQLVRTLDTYGNSRANTCSKALLCGRVARIRSVPNPGSPVLKWFMVRRRIIKFGDASLEFLTYQLPTVGSWPTVALTGNGELGFDSGEGAWETATTSKEGSRRANYPILKKGGSDEKYQYKVFMPCNWDECKVNRSTSIDWRASLVPAAAVIPAPIAYIKIVAVRTLVVECLFKPYGPP
jgi:hypothetical protein